MSLLGRCLKWEAPGLGDDPTEIFQKFTATTTINSGTSNVGDGSAVAAKIDAKVGTVADSGSLSISPMAVEAGRKSVDVTLTYTAATTLDKATVVIDLSESGLVLDSTDNALREGNTGYAHVSGSRSAADLSVDSSMQKISGPRFPSKKVSRLQLR